MSRPQASVVIGFKDWGLDRLQRCIGSIFGSFGELSVEVIVSDYGSADGVSVAQAAESSGARCVRTETDGTWSRSRALNAGFRVATGELFFATDADMIFTPGTLAAVAGRLSAHPNEGIILQCRDLPPGIGLEDPQVIDWAHCQRVATVRPRWGMGGLVATRQAIFDRLRGYDERMHTYGGEDIDFAKRLRRFGIPINWLDRPNVRMYHVWHPSSRVAASLDEAAEAAIANNRRIHSEDLTTARNRTVPEHLGSRVSPLVSVVAAADRSPEKLVPELSSVLGQTVTDLELLLVDMNGSASSVAKQLDDDRVRVVSRPDGAWWHALTHAQGTYTSLHAPGTHYGPTRWQSLLEHTRERHVMPADIGIVAIATDQGDLFALPELAHDPQRRPWASPLMPTGAASTLLCQFAAAATDPNDLIFALQRNGHAVESVAAHPRVEVMSTGMETELALEDLSRSAMHLIRRLSSIAMDTEWITDSPGSGEVAGALHQARQLIKGQVDLTIWTSDGAVLDLVSALAERWGAPARRSWVADSSGEKFFDLVEIVGLPVSAARHLRRQVAASVTTGNTRIDTVADDDLLQSGSTATRVVEEYSRLYAADPERAVWVIARPAGASTIRAAYQEMQRLPGVSVVLHRVIHEPDRTGHHIVIGLVGTADSVKVLLAVKQAIDRHTVVELWLAQGHHGVTLETLVEGAS